MHRALVLLVIAAACNGQPAMSNKTGSNPDWRTVGAYPTWRKVIVDALHAFPAEPAKLPRCSPGLPGVLGLPYVYARGLYAPDVPEGLEMKPRLDHRHPYILEGIENADWETQSDPHLLEVRWSKPPYDWVRHLALVKLRAVTQPTMGSCTGIGAVQDCHLTPGTIDADVVVFDEKSTAICANDLRLEGPVQASVRASGDSIDNPFEAGMKRLLGDLYYDEYDQPPAGDAPWRFAADKELDAFKITVDGAVVREPVLH